MEVSFTKEQAISSWNTYKAIPKADIKNGNFLKVFEYLRKKQNGKTLEHNNFDHKSNLQRMTLLVRAAQENTQEDFVSSVMSGEMPRMKLSAEELELVRGGLALSTAIFLGIVGTAAIVAVGAWGYHDGRSACGCS